MLTPLFSLFFLVKNSGGIALHRRIPHLSAVEAAE